MMGMAAQALFLSCGFIGIGLTISLVGVILQRPGWASLRWPSVSGEILAASPDETAQRRRYQYSVRGTTYTGTRIAFRNTDAADWRRYPPGKTVQVYYDPADPGRAVLEPGGGTAAYLPIGVGGLFFILGLLAGITAFVIK